MNDEHILVVDDEPAFCELCKLWLVQQGYTVSVASDTEQARQILVKQTIGLILLDLALPPSFTPEEGLQLIPECEAPVIVMTGHADRELALTAIKNGAWDFLAKPIDPDMLAIVVKRALVKHELELQLSQLRQQLVQDDDMGLVGVSENIQSTRQLISRIAPTDVPVLITGPSGTGKEIIAKAIHQHSSRKSQSFISVHCGAIPADLLESELFGYKKGAFTGADKDRVGLIALADNGTLFLDEIGEMPSAMQVKLLRVLQEGSFYPVGGRDLVKVNIRIVSATNRDLLGAVAAGHFRDDLFYRIKGITIQTLSLLQRKQDIPALIQHFLLRYNVKNQTVITIRADAFAWLTNNQWKGNVRELKNTIESLAAIAQGQQVTTDEISFLFTGNETMLVELSDESLEQQVKQLEIRLITAALEQCNGNRTHAAQKLKLSRQGLLKKMERYGLNTLREQS
ncbi:sigma-54-dependent Fis family transcriptional regulator [Endozoicomonas sp. SM1973]|uniref:Sigma-54-dependent Fis family transcriptional regulator n=1 Tax=Spartinivicinus marinus TaxID=2994442 RepID=A0A853IAV7_9GAMM|nr:sigma-54 dependent transcriptional regulator [Spartinivicinus marinus]MCX4027453.1 sigma-54 dependent transcriptional regulator [Spartinivicinus marinus]NYZ66375.1 sigma-54-dependent Fis family transcriptional regulator [Spartinivicinus marinus]